MASTLISYSAGSIFGTKVAQSVRAILNAQNMLQEAMNIANALSAGGVTPAALEASPQFGVAAGQGQAFYSAMQSILAQIATMQLALTDLDQG